MPETLKQSRLSPLQVRILKYVCATQGAPFKDILEAFEPLGIKRSDTGKAIIGLLNSNLIFFENELLPNANLVL